MLFLLPPIFSLGAIEEPFGMSLLLPQAWKLVSKLGRCSYLEFFCSCFWIDDFVDCVEGRKGGLTLE